MSIIKSVSKALYDAPLEVEVIEPSNWRNENGLEWFFGNSGIDYHFSYAGHQSSLLAYQTCSPLTAIINKQAQSYINGKTWILNSSGKSKGKESTSEFATKVRRLMAQPNPLQTWKEFEAQQHIYKKVFGFCLLLPVYPVGWEKFGLSEATAMWNIPPYLVDITETNRLFYQTDTTGILSKIVLNYRGTKSELNLKDIHIFNDFIPSMNSLIFSESRIQSLRMPINNIIGIYESLNQQINYAGAQGIFSPGSDTNGPLPLKPDDISKIQTDFRRYGFKKDQWKYVFSPAIINWQQVGRPISEQLYLEQVEDNIMRLCDGYNHPFRLVASKSNNSLGGTDKKVESRNLYADAIIPDAESTYEMWNKLFKARENNCVIEKDFSHIDALQEDRLLNAQAQRAMNEACKLEFFNNQITFNRWREKIGEDTISTIDLNGQQVDAGAMYYYQLIQLGMVFGETNSVIQINQNGTGQENTGQAQSR